MNTAVPDVASLRPPASAETGFGAASRPTGLAEDGVRRHRLPRLSCVVPCHNEAANLGLLLPLLSSTLAGCSESWEVILVDDGSTDGTAALAAEWSTKPGFCLLQLSRNFGKEAALTAGLRAAQGDAVVMLDADMQHSPSLIVQMVLRWQDGADVVYAVRESRAGEGVIKRFGTRSFYKLLNLGDRFEVPAGAGDFRLLDRRAVDALLALPERNRFMKGLYAWVGFHAVALPYTPEDRAHGRSNFSLLRLARLSVDGLTAFTTWPLRAVSLLGTLFALVGFFYGGWLTFTYLLYGHTVSGWTTIVVVMLLFFGVQMISIGVLGEYIGRIFEEVKARPLYIVKRELGQGLEARE